MSDTAALALPFRCDQRLTWRSSGQPCEGRLTSWRGPTEGGVYCLTVKLIMRDACGRQMEQPAMAVLHTPGPFAPPEQINEVARYG